MKNIPMRVLVWRRGIVSLGVFSLVSALLMSMAEVSAASYSPLTAQVNIGERSENVRNLQMFLAENQSMYPSGLVTGYFGPLTAAAVVRFQNQYGIDPVGRVGPLTLGKINNIISSGGWTSSAADISGPWIYSVNRSASSNTATFTWNTNELATGKIFYNTSPITMNEGDINSVGFGSTNGQTAVNDGVARMSQQVTLANLQPNTLYYYVIVSTDLAGNVSVWNPNTTFRTNY
jgi:peptidoglycan hydrolase-like protein with peptidoglycan-binding domain